MHESSRKLVAPELLIGLDVMPDVDFGAGMAQFRQPFASREMPPLPEKLAVVSRSEHRIPSGSDAPDVRVLRYDPPQTDKALRPAMLHIHGGGYVLGDADMSDISNRSTALATGCVVVSVDYRLAPETVWPGALEDCYVALRWLADNADEFGIDRDRIAVSGESAGGGHAAALAIHARNENGPAIRFLLLDAPMLDDRTVAGNDLNPYCGEFVWTPQKNHFGWSAMLGREAGGDDVPEAAVPARTKDLTGLPSTFISVGALDLFLEEDMEFARRLMRVGTPVELHVIPGAYHGFGVAQNAPQVAELVRLRMAALGRAFAQG
ncbi:acetyl esterase/lipase [Novosphingobium sp. PhB165]|uniref:alpha/beta hydrolase n=1 Tax=Novosphingobium sp. PhB165 TaxID=2485105 RepID=UPI00104394E0|nr:alpha/beta hydrolase [Novosphingobium sp. PhB165]TCM20837.1 acetyl esterase/lipase [Novosphingobium sp. PhB165]